MLAHQEQLYHVWNLVDEHQFYFYFSVAVLTFISVLIMAFLLLIKDDNGSDRMIDSMFSFAGILSAVGAIVLLGSIVISTCCGPSSNPICHPFQVARQNIEIIKTKPKLKHWAHLMNLNNRKYEYARNRADNNLKLQDVANKYKNKYYHYRNKIKDFKSLDSYSDPRNQAITVHGGLHYIHEPNRFCNIIPKQYYFVGNIYDDDEL